MPLTWIFIHACSRYGREGRCKEMEGKQIVGAVVETVAKVVIAAVVLMFIYRYSIMAYDYGYRILGKRRWTQSQAGMSLWR